MPATSFAGVVMRLRNTKLPPSIPTAEQTAGRERQLAEMVPVEAGSAAPTPRFTTERFTVAVLAALVAALLAVGVTNGVTVVGDAVAAERLAASKAVGAIDRLFDELGSDISDEVRKALCERTEHEYLGPVLVRALRLPEARPVLTGQRYPESYQYVAFLYRVIFDREADIGGWAWVAQLEEGRADREELVLVLTRSREYVESTR